MAGLKLAAPWTVYYRQVQEMFKNDPEVKVRYDEEEPAIKVFVDNTTKADALSQLLPKTKEFGNVSLKIMIIPGNKQKQPVDLIHDAFDDNKAVNFVYVAKDKFGCVYTYVIFAKEVVQFYNDDITDVHGICSTLYQDIAKEIFEPIRGVFYCTDVDPVDAGFAKPLGEWP
jgi:hypothetical protein